MIYNRISPLAPLLLLVLLIAPDLQAQTGRDTVRSARARQPLVRSETTPLPPPQPLSRVAYPLAGKYSFGGGLGAEYQILPEMSVEVNTTFVAHSAKARFFVVEQNVSPFVSAGFGLAGSRFTRSGVSGRWIEAQVGVERAFDRGFMRVQLHYTINQTAGLGWPQFAPDFTVGYRF